MNGKCGVNRCMNSFNIFLNSEKITKKYNYENIRFF